MYRTCPHCGAALDPGERCDCRDEANAKREECERQRRSAHELLDKLTDPEVVARAYRHIQYLWIHRDNEKAAPSATNTQSGKAKQEVSETDCFASNHTEK